MPLPTNLSAYEDCIEQLDKALDAKNGIRVFFSTEAEAKRFQMRTQYARSLTREANTRIYSSDHPLYNKSPYDKLTVRNPLQVEGDTEWVVAIAHTPSNILAVEEL